MNSGTTVVEYVSSYIQYRNRALKLRRLRPAAPPQGMRCLAQWNASSSPTE
jgi:hypothetical protein